MATAGVKGLTGGMRLNDVYRASSGDRSQVIQFKFLQPDQQETLILLKFQ